MAVVQTGTNTYTFYFDNNINNYSTQEMVDLFTTTSTTNVYYISENDEFILRNPEYGYSGTITFSASDTNISFTLSYQGPGNGICKYPQDNTWLITQGNFKVSNIKGFKLENVNLAENQTLETINNLVNPYIGTKTSLSLQFTRTKASIKIYEDLTQEEYDALTKEPHAFYLVNGVGIYKGTTLISAGANSSMDEIVEELNQAIAAKQDTLVSGTNIKTINGESILGAGNIEVAASDDGVDTAYVENEVLYIDDDTSAGGNASLTEDDVNNIISSNETVVTLTNDVRDLQTDKQDILESGTNIKTINNQSILGSGNITIEGGGTSSELNIFYNFAESDSGLAFASIVGIYQAAYYDANLQGLKDYLNDIVVDSFLLSGITSEDIDKIKNHKISTINLYSDNGQGNVVLVGSFRLLFANSTNNNVIYTLPSVFNLNMDDLILVYQLYIEISDTAQLKWTLSGLPQQ